MVYNARATITTVPGRLRTFTPWMTTAQATGLQTLLTGLQQLQDNALNRFKELQQEIGRVLPAAPGRTAGCLLARRRGRTDRTPEETVRATADSALSSQITQLTAETNNAAAIQTEATARANADGALSAQVTSLDAEVVTTLPG
nr:hypothetical protein [Sinorhizobium medicae]